ncbi:MAG: class I SAM-dependent methyltransferase [Chloroflexi bacterium]|nr:class I SAM-dependent methyltransferase [Chloroflexota bacterium]
MDRWKWYWLTRRYHVIDNPTSEAKLDQFVEALELAPGSAVLDIACGKAELLCRIASRFRASCAGVEVSPYMCDEARRKVAERNLKGLVNVQEIRGQDFTAPEGNFDVALCIGATWVFGGYRGTLAALARWTKPGGLVAVGEPHWIAEPAPEFLSASGLKRGEYGTHAGNISTGETVGLKPVFSVASNLDDWDRYECLTWLSAARYVRENPSDPDVPEIEALIAGEKRQYIQWGRDCFSWAIYLFEKPLR